MWKPSSFFTLLIAVFIPFSFFLNAGCADKNRTYIKQTVRELSRNYAIELRRVRSGKKGEPKTQDFKKFGGNYKNRKVYLMFGKDHFKSLSTLALSVVLDQKMDFPIEIERRNELSKLFHIRGITNKPALYHEYIIEAEYERKAVKYLESFPSKRYFAYLKNFEKLSIGPKRISVLYESKYPIEIKPDRIIKILDVLVILSGKLSKVRASFK